MEDGFFFGWTLFLLFICACLCAGTSGGVGDIRYADGRCDERCAPLAGHVDGGTCGCVSPAPEVAP